MQINSFDVLLTGNNTAEPFVGNYKLQLLLKIY